MPDVERKFVCPAEKVRNGTYIEASVGGRQLLVCRVDGVATAIENKCSHLGKPLSGGRLIGNRLVCPHHSAAFDVTTGQALSFPASKPIAVFPVVEQDGVLTVAADEAGGPSEPAVPRNDSA